MIFYVCYFRMLNNYAKQHIIESKLRDVCSIDVIIIMFALRGEN